MDIANSQQALNIGLVRVGVERIYQEQNGIHLALGNPGGDLGVAPDRAGEQPFDRNRSGGL